MLRVVDLRHTAEPCARRSFLVRKEAPGAVGSVSALLIGRAFTPQIDAAEIAKGSDIVKRILASFVAQVKPIGQQVHTQHALQSYRRAAVSSLGIMGFDYGTEMRPRHQHLHACEKLRLARGSAVYLESLRRCKRHLFHDPSPPNALATTTVYRETCSVFP